jgi:hypothetical protein
MNLSTGNDIAARAPVIRFLFVLVIVCPFSRVTLAAECSATSTGLIALNDLGPGLYQGFEGGLYPGGTNTPPTTRDGAFRAAAFGVAPLDAAGNVDWTNGKIGFTTIGMSNTAQHSSAFRSLVQDPVAAGINPNIVFFVGAQGGQSASKWASNESPAWTTLEERTINAGLTNLQVQIVWVLQAEPASNTAPFPAGAAQIKDWLLSAMQILKVRFPNVRLAYFSSRIYGGYATTTLNPEPCAYETAFAVKWLVEQQIDGDPALAHDGPAPMAPLLVWGPYLWADGLGPDGVVGGVGGRGDGLEWECADMADDGTHPSQQGAAKTAQLLFDWLFADPNSQLWFLPGTSTDVGRSGGKLPALRVNPNPTDGDSFLELPERFEEVEVLIFDVKGRRVDRFSAPVDAGGVTIALGQHPSGIYFAQARTRGNVLIGASRVTVIR